MIKIKWLTAAMCIVCIQSVFSEDTKYQRVSLDRKENELTVEAGLDYQMQTASVTDEIYTLNPSLALTYDFNAQHSANFSVPFHVALYDNPDTKRNAFYSFGDIQVSYEYTKKIDYVNLFLGSQLQIPVAESSEYAAREGVYTVGSGRYNIGLSVAASGIRDPIVWSATFKYDVGLPKEERFYTSWRPGDMQLSGSILKLANERFGFSLGLYQNILLPQINDGKWKSNDFSASTVLHLETLILFEKDYAKVSADIYTFPQGNPVVIGLLYGHTFKLGKTGEKR
jgi:hypothetical protein